MKVHILSVDAAYSSTPLRAYKSDVEAQAARQKCDALARIKKMHVDTPEQRSFQFGFDYDGMTVINDVGGIKFSLTEVDLV